MKVISVVFFKLSNDKEPVKDWLLLLDKQDRLIIGQDIKTVELGWPLGMPLIRKMDNKLWEVRCSLKGKRIARVFLQSTGARWSSCMALLRKLKRHLLMT